MIDILEKVLADYTDRGRRCLLNQEELDNALDLADLVHSLKEAAKQPHHPVKQDFFKWTVEIEVHKTWVADGFDLTDTRAHDMLCRELSYAYGQELRAKVTKTPDPRAVSGTQGGPTARQAAAQMSAPSVTQDASARTDNNPKEK